MYQLNNNQEWDTDFFHSLMSDKPIVSSKEAKTIREKLERAGALPHLDNHFDWAMLCIGYCFAKGLAYQPKNLLKAPDSQGTNIRQFTTCFQDYSRLWLAVLSDALFRHNPDKAATIDDLYRLIADLWHTGAVKLDEFWERCRAFKPEDELAQRQEFLNELAELAIKNAGVGQHTVSGSLKTPLTNAPSDDLSAKMVAILQNMGKDVKSAAFVLQGVRDDFYRIQFAEFTEWQKLHKAVCSALSMDEKNLHAQPDTECGLPHTYRIRVRRQEDTWLNLDKTMFQAALKSYQGDMILPLCIGANEKGEPIFADLVEARHVLVGGTPGSGKSVMVRTLLHSLFELVEPKMLDVAIFDAAGDYTVFKDKINLWGGNIQGNRNTVTEQLENFVEEMKLRLAKLQEYGVDNVYSLPENVRPPYLVIMVEELAALLDTDKDAEQPLTELLQEGRKAGVLLILATQEPDSATFSSRLRANIPSRIAMRVSKSTSSTMILGETGAEKLTGSGDHLVRWNGGAAQFLHGYNV